MPLKPGKPREPTWLNSSSQAVMEDLQYSNEDIKHIIDWTKRMILLHSMVMCSLLTTFRSRRDHLALSRHVLNGTQGR
jgi:hypothetical protein